MVVAILSVVLMVCGVIVAVAISVAFYTKGLTIAKDRPERHDTNNSTLQIGVGCRVAISVAI